jgi:hypothetical protein
MDAGAISPGIKGTVRAEVKIEWSFTSAPPYVFMAWRLIKHMNNLLKWVLVIYDRMTAGKTFRFISLTDKAS